LNSVLDSSISSAGGATPGGNGMSVHTINNKISNTTSAVLFSKVSQRIAADNSKSTTPKIDFQEII